MLLPWAPMEVAAETPGAQERPAALEAQPAKPRQQLVLSRRGQSSLDDSLQREALRQAFLELVSRTALQDALLLAGPQLLCAA